MGSDVPEVVPSTRKQHAELWRCEEWRLCRLLAVAGVTLPVLPVSATPHTKGHGRRAGTEVETEARCPVHVFITTGNRRWKHHTHLLGTSSSPYARRSALKMAISSFACAVSKFMPAISTSESTVCWLTPVWGTVVIYRTEHSQSGSVTQRCAWVWPPPACDISLAR